MDAPLADPSISKIIGRNQSFSSTSQKSDESHTAADFIKNQLQLEAEAREVLPYSITECTKPLGPLRQNVFACLTCNPSPLDASDPYSPAGVCYSCSVQCHGEHTLVEIFVKRDFTCDCGTSRMPASACCTLRIHPATNTKGSVHSETPDPNNKYNQNFKNRFCGCELEYDAYAEKGTMFQCIGLGTTETGGCGEDWWHPGCIAGLGATWYQGAGPTGSPKRQRLEGLLDSVIEVSGAAANSAELAPAAVDTQETEKSALLDGSPQTAQFTTTEVESTVTDSTIATLSVLDAPDVPADEDEDDDPPLPPGFPNEDDFEGFICYKCVESNPWIKRYAGAPGFLPPVFKRSGAPSPEVAIASIPHKRKAEDEIEGTSKRMKEDNETPITSAESLSSEAATKAVCTISSLPPAPTGALSLFFKADFRDNFCRCSGCFPNLAKHPQLLEEEETYEPPVSESGDEGGNSTVGSGSVYERGESALKNVDRVKALEGVMAYNHMKDKLKPFFQQFAESGKVISAEDIKAHFAKMRGDEQAIKDAGEGARADNRQGQSGY